MIAEARTPGALELGVMLTARTLWDVNDVIRDLADGIDRVSDGVELVGDAIGDVGHRLCDVYASLESIPYRRRSRALGRVWTLRGPVVRLWVNVAGVTVQAGRNAWMSA